MKNLFKYFSVFIILMVILSGLAACGGKTGVTTNTSNEKLPPAANTTASADNSQKSDSSFPLAPAAIAKADIKMVDGTTFKLEEQKGNVILFNMWATWCGPCRAEMPELVALQDKYKDKNLKIIGLDADNEPADLVKSFGEKMKLNYDLGWVDEITMGEFLKISTFSGIPQSFLIDRQGRLRGVFTGGGPKVVGQLKDTIEKVVSE